MAVLEQEMRQASELTVTRMTRHLFSREDYHALAAVGLLNDQRVELIEGEIIDMAPIGDWHAAVTHPMAVLLEELFGSGFSARNQVPIMVGGDRQPSEPQPDITVVVGAWRDYGARKPGPKDIVLVVEVADTSLEFDRNIKARLYAAAGIPEYWIVNLVDNCLEVHRNPANAAYGAVNIYKPTDRVTPLHAPGGSISVAEFLPNQKTALAG